MFVLAIMVISGTQPILQSAEAAVRLAARTLPLAGSVAFYFFSLALLPLLGSLITEPAAMTLAALMLWDSIFSRNASLRLQYVSLAVLLVNVSIGGTLTPFAAPPVLMVAAKWQWDLSFMLRTFGWKAAIAVTTNALAATIICRHELAALPYAQQAKKGGCAPLTLTLLHFAFLASIVTFSHHAAVFMGLFLLFLGIAHAYRHYQTPLILREGLLVAFFLSGLVVLGGMQRWWLERLLLSMSSSEVFFGATALTAITDNAALTYLRSLVPGLSESFKYALAVRRWSCGVQWGTFI